VRYAGEVVDGVPPILHRRLFHPANDHYGMSPIKAAATAIDIHNTASEWNKALLDNSARPSGALVYTGGEGRMTAEQHPGRLYKNPKTGEEVRIMNRPSKVNRSDPPQKHFNDYYYRYKSGKGRGWEDHMSIPNPQFRRKSID
jgi:phage portal protein BeeE